MIRFAYSPKWQEARRAGFTRRRGAALADEHNACADIHRESKPSTAAPPTPLIATVISAAPLPSSELEDLVARLQEKHKCPIHTQVRVQAGYIGRVRVEVGADAWNEPVSAESPAVSAALVDDYDISHCNAPLVGRGDGRLESDPTVPDTHMTPEPSMLLGEPIAVPATRAPDRYEFLQSSLCVRYPGMLPKVLLLVGAKKGCGVSTVAGDLAASFARNSSGKVLLIDANVRSKRGDTPMPQGPGSDDAEVCLRRLLTAAPVLQAPDARRSNLFVLPSGMPCDLSLAVFQSTRFDELLQRARELFEYVIIDGPSLAEHPETLMLSRKADGVILVVESEKTRKQSALWAKRQIEMTGTTLLGVILNRRKYRIPDWLYKRI